MVSIKVPAAVFAARTCQSSKIAGCLTAQRPHLASHDPTNSNQACAQKAKSARLWDSREVGVTARNGSLPVEKTMTCVDGQLDGRAIDSASGVPGSGQRTSQCVVVGPVPQSY